MKAATDHSAVMKKVQEAVSRIVSVRNLGGRIVLNIPVMCPSGSSAVVEVERDGDSYHVSDMGHGRAETELLAAQDFYAPAAKQIAEEYGISFDGNSMTLQVPSSRLESAIVCLANASSQACAEAIREAERTTEIAGETLVRETACKSAGGGGDAWKRRDNEAVFERLQGIFGPEHVDEHLIIKGRTGEWDVHNVVSFPGRHKKAAFEFMNNHWTSAASKLLMFSDIKKEAGEKISLNVLVRSPGKLTEKARVVSGVANIIPFDALYSDREHLMERAKISPREAPSKIRAAN